MLRETIPVRFDGTQDRQAFDRELAERPDLMRWLRLGAQQADQFVGPRILRGVLGRTEVAMNAAITEFTESGLRGLREENSDESQVHFWRLGFEAAAFEARDVRLGRGKLRPVS